MSICLPQRERDDIDPGTLMSTVHSGSYIPGEETGAAPAPVDFSDLEYDLVGADSGEDGAAEQPEVVFSDRTHEGGPIDDPGDGGGRSRGVRERGSVADRDDAMPPEDGTGEESDGADGAVAGVSARTSDGETFVDETTVETTVETVGVAATDTFEGDRPARRRAEQIDGENDVVIEQFQPNFANAPLLGTSDASGDEAFTERCTSAERRAARCPR